MPILIEATGLARPSAGDRKADLLRDIKAVEGRLKRKRKHLAALRLLKAYLQPDEYQHIKERLQREIKRREEQFYDLLKDRRRFEAESDPGLAKLYRQWGWI
jgi:hypothetical protein